MPIIRTRDNRIVLKKPKSMMVVPYFYDNELEDFVLGDTIYDIYSIIGDSIVLEETDGETTIKANEHTGNILVSNTTKGETKFTTQCLDVQDSILKAIFGAYTGVDERGESPVKVNGLAAIPSEYKTVFALVRITFNEEDQPDVYLPKVHLNSHLMMQQMKTRGTQGNISGNVLPSSVCVGFGDTNFLAKFVGMENDGLYIVDTPILFCPSGYTPYFFHHYENKEYTFSKVLWNNEKGSSVTTVTVSENDLSRIEE